MCAGQIRYRQKFCEGPWVLLIYPERYSLVYGLIYPLKIQAWLYQKVGRWPNTFCYCPADTSRNSDVVITSKRRHFDVITSKWRRFDVITTLLLRHVFSGCLPQRTHIQISSLTLYKAHYMLKLPQIFQYKLLQICREMVPGAIEVLFVTEISTTVGLSAKPRKWFVQIASIYKILVSIMVLLVRFLRDNLCVASRWCEMWGLC